MIEAVIFDMDGVLIDSEPVWQMHEKKAIEEACGFEITPEMQNETFGLNTAEVIMHWYHYKPWANLNAHAITDKIYTKVLDHFKANGIPANGVPEILDFFKMRNIPMGVASSSPQHLIDAILDKLGIRNYFLVAHSSDQEAYGKPHPDVYINTCKALKANPAYCLAFEDSVNGMIAAKSARMKVIAIPPAIKKSQKEYVLADLVLNDLAAFTSTHFNQLTQK